MTNSRKIGATGLSILDIKPSTPPKKKQTAQEIARWCEALPMADTGAAAKKLFIQLTDISETPMTAQERYAVMELLRSPNRTICTSLKRHYIEQLAPLTEHKLIIANLRQTLLTLMADNYKLILEELHNKPKLSQDEILLMATVIVRIYYYLNVLLICRYQLYTYTLDNTWHEVHLLYKYAKKRNMLEMKVPCQFAPNHQTSILQAYLHIILLYATDPYQWRQREQHSLNKAIEMWALLPTVYEANQIPNKKAGIYIIDLDKDEPPTSANFRRAPITPSCIAVDLANSVTHLKQVLDKLQHDHLKAKIENPNDPEFSVTAPTIAKLIKVWSQTIQRTAERFPIQAQIRIVFSLNAAYFYVNGEKEFNPHPINLQKDIDETGTAKKSFSGHLNLQSYEVIEEENEDEDEKPTRERDEILSSTQAEEAKAKDEKTQAAKNDVDSDGTEEAVSTEVLYHIYDYNIENINPHGFCIVIKDKSYPPFQAGEVVAFKNLSSGNKDWGIGSVRWLRRQKNEDFQIGVEIIAPFAKAAGIQILRAGKPASRLSR
ncbi:MAG TPA: hypothetical protein VLG38_08325, partial [Gammaproteobacteria bacterium]|nr:hypothetical protein [Gammaproteobacteria bacterium]